MWVLLEEFQTKMHGKEVYFKGWSNYAPATTEHIQEAHRFADKQEAKLSAAYRYRESFFVPIEVEVSVAVKNKAA